MGRLDDLLRQGARQREEDEVAAIVGGRNDRDNAEGRGKFSAGCVESENERRQRALDKAREELANNPSVVDNPDAQSRFIAAHPDAPYPQLRAAVNGLYNLRHPKPAQHDSLGDQNTEFVQRSRPSF